MVSRNPTKINKYPTLDPKVCSLLLAWSQGASNDTVPTCFAPVVRTRVKPSGTCMHVSCTVLLERGGRKHSKWAYGPRHAAPPKGTPSETCLILLFPSSITFGREEQQAEPNAANALGLAPARYIAWGGSLSPGLAHEPTGEPNPSQ